MNQALCIIIHGFTGNPSEIESLANALKRMDFEVMTPLLPGHSINKERMKKVNALEWVQMIEKMVEQGLKENKKIHLIGFSMGAMIASIMAYRYQISTLVLLSPAVYVFTPFLLKMKLEKCIQQSRKKNLLSAHTRLNNRSLIDSAPIYNLFQFQKVVRQAKRIFHQITIPICIIHGLMDITVDPRSSEFIYHVVSSKEKQLHYLPLSNHHICQDCEADTVIQLVAQFLEKYQ